MLEAGLGLTLCASCAVTIELERPGTAQRAALVRRAQDSQTPEQLRASLEQLQPLRDRKEYNIAIAAAGNVGLLKLALKLLDTLENGSDRALRPDLVSCPRLQVEPIRVIGHELTRGRLCCCCTDNSAMKACERAMEWQVALAILERMEAIGVAATSRTYTAAVGACTKAQQFQRARETFRVALQRGQADLILCNAALSAAETDEDARAVMGEIVALELQPDRISFNSAIAACNREGNSAASQRWLSQMARAGIAPDLISYSSAIRACGLDGSWQRAVQLFEQLEAQGLRADLKVYSALLTALETSGDWEKVAAWLDRMERDGVERDIGVFNTAMQAAVVSGRLKEGFALLSRIHASTELTPASYAAHRILLEGCRAAGELDRASAVQAYLRRGEPRSSLTWAHSYCSALCLRVAGGHRGARLAQASARGDRHRRPGGAHVLQRATPTPTQPQDRSPLAASARTDLLLAAAAGAPSALGGDEHGGRPALVPRTARGEKSADGPLAAVQHAGHAADGGRPPRHTHQLPHVRGLPRLLQGGVSAAAPPFGRARAKAAPRVQRGHVLLPRPMAV